MSLTRRIGRAAAWMAGGVGLAAVGYAAYASVTWCRYGRVAPAGHDEIDPLLDSFMPEYEVTERHQTRIAASPAIALAAAADTDLLQSAVVRAIFRIRELVLGAEPAA